MAFRRRQSRRVEKPAIPSKSIKTLAAILDAHSWHSMITFKPISASPAETNKWMESLYESCKYALRNDETGFLIKREFGDDNQNAHFHIVFTAPLPESVVTSLKVSFLRLAKLKDNRGRRFQYDCEDPSGKHDQPRLRAYLKKVSKHSVDTIHPPRGWSLKELGRPYKIHRLASLKKRVSPPASSSLNIISVREYNWREREHGERWIPTDRPADIPVISLYLGKGAVWRASRFPRYVA